MTAILQQVTSRLDAESIPYMLAGSFAMLYYALPRMTRDIDIVVQIDQKDAERIYELFCKDYYVSLEAIREAIHTYRVFNIIHEAAAIKIDFFVIPQEGFFISEFARRTKVNLLGKAISLISPEDLVISKLMWARDAGSAQQMADVANLLVSLPDLDWSYMDAWVAQLGLDEWYEKCRRDARG
ncbi:MAG: nucleotidyltransferase family protein [Thermaerobacter sp.]|nr:nucleotidyltransferase family protein [Thermaerobacter sp.]